MYAIETKKRKFDRILGTIKDHASPQPQTPNAPLGQQLSSASPLESSSTKKRRLDLTTKGSRNSSITSPQPTASYLPASREAFLERLETFGPITKWHIPSTEDISAAAWAKRGWRCIDTDTVGCKACDEQLLVKLDEEPEVVAKESGKEEKDEEDAEDDLDGAATLRHQLLVERYRAMIVTAHAESCPWRNRGCDESIQRIAGLLSAKSALETLRTRYDGLRKFDIPSAHLPSEEISWPPEGIAYLRLSADDTEGPQLDRLNLAMAGWQGSITREDVAECRACFRSLGLWLYRGEAPIMERLDAVDSHLEYCPWRSPGAQSTRIDWDGERKLVPAWMLVARATKDAIHLPAPDAPAAMEKPVEEEMPLGEKERDAKVKELLRRVKDLKKPFNVKALLRKKTAAKRGRSN